MKSNFLQEIFVSLALIALLVLFLNPFNFWMPNALVMTMVFGLAVVFAVFSGLIWREYANDEREILHRMLAGRIAYLTGTGVLVLGIILQSFKHELDAWLVLALGVMILAKIAGIIYGQTKY